MASLEATPITARPSLSSTSAGDAPPHGAAPAQAGARQPLRQRHPGDGGHPRLGAGDRRESTRGDGDLGLRLRRNPGRLRAGLRPLLHHPHRGERAKVTRAVGGLRPGAGLLRRHHHRRFQPAPGAVLQVRLPRGHRRRSRLVQVKKKDLIVDDSPTVAAQFLAGSRASSSASPRRMAGRVQEPPSPNA